jgi:multiple sugar transport system ATP-binding protein
VTTVYVTHDQVEAMTMGDRVAVMKDGVLQQCDTPRVLYESPINSFVAGFIGSPAMNLIEGHIDTGGLLLGETVIPIPAKLKEHAGAVGSAVTVGLRPEAIELVSEGHGIPAVVNLVEEMGAEAYVYAQLAAHVTQSVTAVNDIIARVEPRSAPRSGDTIHLRVREESILLFDTQTGNRIGAQTAPTAVAASVA